MSLKINLIIIGALLTIIVILSAIIIFDKDSDEVINSERERQLEDSLLILTQDRARNIEEQVKLKQSIDSLLSLDAKIIYRRDEKTKFIYLTSDPSVLDSLIRSTWK